MCTPGSVRSACQLLHTVVGPSGLRLVSTPPKPTAEQRAGKVMGSLEVHYLNSPSQVISVYQTHAARSRKSRKRGTDRCPRSILAPVGVNSKGGHDSRG